MFFILSYAFYLVGKLNLNLKDLRLTKGLATGGYRSAKSIISMILQSHWEPYKILMHVDKFHNYLQANKIKTPIPKELK